MVDFVSEVEKWYAVLMPKVQPYLYASGGPIIMVQIENEYGSYACDLPFRHWMKEVTVKYIQNDAVVFTSDGPHKLRCGKIDGVFATVNFGPGINDWEQLIQIRNLIIN